MRATPNTEPHNHPHTACCGPLFLARCSWLTMACRIAIVLALAPVTGCFTGPSDNAGFGNIQDLAQLDGTYRNLGDSGNPQARVYLSEIIWPEDTSLPHKSIGAIEVRETAAGTLTVKALRRGTVIKEDTFVEGVNFTLQSGRILLKRGMSFPNDNIAGAAYTQIDIGIDARGQGKYRESGAFIGVGLLIPVAIMGSSDVRFERLHD